MLCVFLVSSKQPYLAYICVLAVQLIGLYDVLIIKWFLVDDGSSLSNVQSRSSHALTYVELHPGGCTHHTLRSDLTPLVEGACRILAQQGQEEEKKRWMCLISSPASSISFIARSNFCSIHLVGRRFLSYSLPGRKTCLILSEGQQAPVTVIDRKVVLRPFLLE